MIRRALLPCLLLALLCSAAHAQLRPYPTGMNRPEVSWHQIETDHFLIVYHDGLDSIAVEAADVAEAIYPVVTGNLRTPMPGRTPIFLSDLDDVPNAFAMSDEYIFVWMRGILDDMPLGGIRSAGSSKWLRSVITHEFTHTVIAQATRTWINFFAPLPGVPRWFNEGTARFMEPDDWTTDVDMVLRVAAVNGGLDYARISSRLSGTLLYETGHSLVRFMTQRLGDTILARILAGGHTPFGYDFEQAVREATGRGMSDIYEEWFRTVTVLYGSEYGIREETNDFAPAITRRFVNVTGLRYSPDRTKLAVLGAASGQGVQLWIGVNDSAGQSDAARSWRLLNEETGFDGEFSWSPDGGRLVLSKGRLGTHAAQVHDLCIVDVESGDMRRLTSDAGLTDPAWSPDGSAILAVRKRLGRDNLVLVDPATGEQRPLTRLTGDVQLYTPAWSPDGSRIATSIFDENSLRSIVVMKADGTAMTRLTTDTANNRYPVWSPDGTRIAFTSHATGIPNVQIMNADGSDRRFVTDVAGGVHTAQWLPGTDTLAIVSFDSYKHIIPHLVASSRRVVPTANSNVREKYRRWQQVKLARRVPPADRIPIAAKTPAEGYLPLAHIEPITPVFPIVQPDLSADGSRWSLRPGLLTVWTDPMGIHSLVGYVDYGPVSGRFGGELLWLYNRLLPEIAVYGEHTVKYARMVADVPYYQRNSVAGVRASLAIPAPNTSTVAHGFQLGAQFRRVEPWNGAQYSAGSMAAGLAPVAADLTELNAGYLYRSRTFFFTGGYTRSEKALGSTIGYDRLDALLMTRVRFFFDNVILLGRLEGTAQWGGQLPQERIGLDRYDQFRETLDLSDATDPVRLQSSYRVPGWSEYVYGDRVAIAKVGIETSLGIERLIPYVSQIGARTVFWVAAGSAWFADSTALFDIPIRASYGVELRTTPRFDLTVAAGIALPMKERPRRDFYLRVEAGL